MPGDAVDVIIWNDLDRLEKRLRRGDVAGVIMEPIMCNQNVILPDPGYLEGVRRICTETGTILIFDEVITGFRVAPGGAQALLGVTPDLTVFGKAIANGLPVAAIVGQGRDHGPDGHAPGDARRHLQRASARHGRHGRDAEGAGGRLGPRAHRRAGQAADGGFPAHPGRDGK